MRPGRSSVALRTLGAVLLAGAVAGCSCQNGGSVEPDDSWWRPLDVQLPVPDPDGLENTIASEVASLSLEEKVGQMVMVDIRHVTPAEISQYNLGAVLNGGGAWPNRNKRAPPSEWLELADALFEASLTSNSGIPLLWGTDAVHGHNNVFGATIFPHNIGLGAAGDEELLFHIGRATGVQMSVTGQDWNFAPTVAVARDDRWGRTYESFSEDPRLVRRLADDFVRGLQGTFTAPGNALATAKHYIGDGGTSRGTDQGDCEMAEEELVPLHAPGLFSAVEAGAQAVMLGMNSWQGEKLHGHRYLITDILKDTLGFDGIVLSDWFAHRQVPRCDRSSCPQAVNAGIDMFMVPEAPHWQAFVENTVEQVRSGLIPESRIDDAVTRILRVKHRAGLFDAPRPSRRPNAGRSELLASPESRALAREAVRKSLVLLKNRDGILPLSRDARVLVAGRSAHSLQNQTGGWTLSWQGTGNLNEDFPAGESIWEGIQAIAPGAVLDEEGRSADRSRHDVAIVVIGEDPYAELLGDLGDDQTLEHGIRYPEDRAVIDRIRAAGVPVVTVLLSGRVLYVNPELNRSAAFVAGWLPGTEGGGVADVLFRTRSGRVDHDFTGKLPFSWPRMPCQVPSNAGAEGYEPLFPLGYGLTYARPEPVNDRLPEPTQSEGCGEAEDARGT